MTDIQEFIEAPGRAEQVAEIQRRIEVEEIQYLYCQFVTPAGSRRRRPGSGAFPTRWHRTYACWS